MKKKLKYSSISISDALIEELYKKHEDNTGLDSNFISKKALIHHVLFKYLEDKK